MRRSELRRLEDVADSVALQESEAIARPLINICNSAHSENTFTLTAEIPLTDAELKLLQTLIYQECGMYFDECCTHFLRDRLQRRLKACNLDSFYSYYRLLTSREGKQAAELASRKSHRQRNQLLSRQAA